MTEAIKSFCNPYKKKRLDSKSASFRLRFNNTITKQERIIRHEDNNHRD